MSTPFYIKSVLFLGKISITYVNCARKDLMFNIVINYTPTQMPIPLKKMRLTFSGHLCWIWCHICSRLHCKIGQHVYKPYQSCKNNKPCWLLHPYFQRHVAVQWGVPLTKSHSQSVICVYDFGTELHDILSRLIFCQKINFVTATKQLCPSVIPFSQCPCYCIILKFLGVITIDNSDVNAKGQDTKL